MNTIFERVLAEGYLTFLPKFYMGPLKTLKFPLLISAFIFGVATLNFGRVDRYATVLAAAYLVLGSLAAGGKEYLKLTGRPRKLRAVFAMATEPPSVFILTLGIFYMVTGDLHWIFITLASFFALLVFAISFSDWKQAKEDNAVKSE